MIDSESVLKEKSAGFAERLYVGCEEPSPWRQRTAWEDSPALDMLCLRCLGH